MEAKVNAMSRYYLKGLDKPRNLILTFTIRAQRLDFQPHVRPPKRRRPTQNPTSDNAFSFAIATVLSLRSQNGHPGDGNGPPF